jgi:NADH-quinone oxidoreductase subunit K
MGAVPLAHYLSLASALFAIGFAALLIRRNALVVFMGVELMLNAANMTFLAFSRAHQTMSGQAAAFFVIAVAAAEAAVGLAIMIALVRSRKTLNVDEVDTLKY